MTGRLSTLASFALAGVLSFAARAAAQGPEKLLLLPSQVGAGVPASAVSGLENLVLEALHDTGRFDVIGRADVAALVGLDAKKQLAGCDDTECATQLAGALDVKLAAALSVDRLGDTTLLTLRILETEKLRVLGRSQQTFTGETSRGRRRPPRSWGRCSPTTTRAVPTTAARRSSAARAPRQRRPSRRAIG